MIDAGNRPSADEPEQDALLELRDISKAYGRVRALTNVNLHIGRGEIVALLGDNGAGKSTLIKILAGFHQPDSGAVLIRGEQVELRDPGDARARGISTVFQDLALVDVLDVARNIYLGREPTYPFGIVKRAQMRRETTELFKSLRIGLRSARAHVAMLSGGQRQGVAISRAVSQGGQLFLLDEPTAALGLRESRRVIELITELREQGFSVLVVSHNIEQIFPIADRFYVLRLGSMVAGCDRDSIDHEDLVGYITGAKVAAA